MIKVNDVYKFLDSLAPVGMKMDFDNVGLLVGKPDSVVSRIITALDITDEVIEEAVDLKADLIVAHHPLFFSLKTVTDDDNTGRKIIKLIENGISAICMHTNLDAAEDGVNDALAKKLGLRVPELLTVDGYDEAGKPYCIGRYGEIENEIEFSAFMAFVKSQLGCNGVRYHSAGKPVKRIAVMGGSGGSEITSVLKKNCDTYVTADVKYHQFLDAKDAGINIIDADHFCTENVIIPVIAEKLAAKFSDVEIKISEAHHQTVKFF